MVTLRIFSSVGNNIGGEMVAMLGVPSCRFSFPGRGTVFCSKHRLVMWLDIFLKGHSSIYAAHFQKLVRFVFLCHALSVLIYACWDFRAD